MRRKRLIGIGIIIGIGITWALFTALVVWGLVNGERRTTELGELALERLLGVQRTQLDMVFQRIEQDLMEEAAFVSEHDSLSDEALISRWAPVLESDWTIRSICLASEGGEESELARGENTWRFTSTVGSIGTGLPLVTEWPLQADRSTSRTHIGEGVLDPRRASWFGQALEDHGVGPTWSMTSVGKDSIAELQLSRLVRARADHGPYRVVRISLYPAELVRSLGPPPATYGALYLGSDGRSWCRADTGSRSLAEQAALAQWSLGKRRDPFTLHNGEQDWMARIVPYTVNGTQFYIGAVIRTDALEEWTHGERLALWVAAALLLLLGVLLTWSFLRNRRTDRRVRRQEKRSRTQEQKLAKALGEREILDREVHHRVKNNLQVVSSLLNLQAERIQDVAARREFIRGKRRIDSMALVHHKLYAQQDLRAIDLRLFLSQVASAMKAMFEPGSRSVSHSVDTADITTNADTSIQLGIILCELMANCYQHAFPYVTGGHVDIIVRKAEDDLYRMTVKDNGKGLDRDPANRGTELGLELVEALAEQIDGGVETLTADGTKVEVTFRMQGEAKVNTL